MIETQRVKSCEAFSGCDMETKNKARLIVVVLLAFACLSACAKKEACVIAKSGLRIRSEAGVKSEHLSTIPYKEVVKVLDKKSDSKTIGGKKGYWTLVRWNKEKGWAFGGFLRKGNCVSLHEAANEGDIKRVKLLISQKANINAKDKKYRRSPLHWAVVEGHTEIAKLLLAKGAKVNAIDKKYSRSPLHWAVIEGRTEIAKLLLAKGAELNAIDKKYNWTPLHWAAFWGRTEIVKLLLSNNETNVNAKDKYGLTPLQWAVDMGHTKIVKLLKKRATTM